MIHERGSAGFAVRQGGDEWNGNRRRVRRAMLDRIALTPFPAFEGAEIVAVRGR